MKNLILALTILVVSVASHATESINFGVWTEHYAGDCSCYNEDNDFIQYTTMNDETRHFATFGTFTNSHYTKSEFVGVGHSEVRMGIEVSAALVAIKGYENHLNTHYKGILFAPVLAAKYGIFKLILLGPVVNAGLEFSF